MIFIFFTFLVFLSYALYSYTQVDPNLVLSQNVLYWAWQQGMWQLGYHQRELSALLYSVCTVLFLVWWRRVLRTTQKQRFIALLLGVVCMLGTYPALSHDVFNYIFNAKMVLIYQANPHIKTALDFYFDPWIRFMHNVHTPAPYGYGWTAFSLVPFIAGFGKFTLTLFSFKIFSALSYVLWSVGIWQVGKMLGQRNQLKKTEFSATFWLTITAPLVLLEGIGNVHNDLWMMAGVAWSIVFILNFSKTPLLRKKVIWLCLSGLCFVAAGMIKFASFLLLPIWLYWLVQPKLRWDRYLLLTKYWGDISALLVLAPLLTLRSQLFHPWYLIWSLTFLPFVRIQFLRWLLIGLSVSSLWRYIPILYSGEYTNTIWWQQVGITWAGGVSIAIGCTVLIWIEKRVSSGERARMKQ